jgi:hypothetical protein
MIDRMTRQLGRSDCPPATSLTSVPPEAAIVADGYCHDARRNTQAHFAELLGSL